LVDSLGQLGQNSSSARFKHNIQDIDERSENIFQLRPVSFVYNADTTETIQYGLIAEEVDEVFPTIVVRDDNDEP